MALQGVSTTELPATIPAVQSQVPLLFLQVMSQLQALDMACRAVREKCEAANVSLVEERKRRTRDRARCEETEEELMNKLQEQRKLAYAAVEDKRWLEALMTEVERRYNEFQAKCQEELDTCQKSKNNTLKQIQEELNTCQKNEDNALKQIQEDLDTCQKNKNNTLKQIQEELDTCQKNESNTLHQIQILKEKEKGITSQLTFCNTELQRISQCPTERNNLRDEKNGMAEALSLFDYDAQNEMLLRAARVGKARAVRALVNSGAYINVKDGSGNYRRTPLHWGATEGHVEVMKTLIDLGADARHDVDSDIYTLLHSAARYGRPDAVRFLLAGKWIPVDATVPSKRETPLHLASRHGHNEVIVILLSAGANIDARNFRGSTPLHMAAYNGRKAAVITLVNQGASLTLRDTDGNPYQNAIAGGHRDIAEFIKSKM